MESNQYVARSRSPIRGRIPVPVDPVVGLHRVPVFGEHVVEHVPVGGRSYLESRSRSPLLGRTQYGVSGAEQRMSAATPTVAHRTIDENK